MIFTVNVLDWQHSVLDKQNEISSDVWKQTTALLKICHQHHIRATFFLLDNIVTKYPVLVRKILAEGHEVGCLLDISSSDPNIVETVSTAVKQLNTITEDPIRASRCLYFDEKSDNEEYCYSLKKNNILYDSSLSFSEPIETLINSTEMGMFNEYNIQQYPQATRLKMPLSNHYLIRFGGSSFRLLPYLVNHIFNLGESSSCRVFSLMSYDLPCKTMEYRKGKHTLSFWNRLDFVGRSSVPNKLLKLLQDYPLTSLAEYYERGTSSKHSGIQRESLI
ncbi:MAG: polysaccharide deacetylase family protein [Thiotrichaceae bacterium]|nr:polysaccharide deacetylase family protein [Thiotrichaceae bacterium]